MGIVFQQGGGLHDLAGLAVTALRDVDLPPRFLQRMHIADRKALDGRELAPAAAAIGVTQLRIAFPSMCTVQAPHNAIPQPNLVPVRPSTSRRNQSSGISGLPPKRCSVPFTYNRIIVHLGWFVFEREVRGPFMAPG
jgi:hypothetical protein